jgi:hypothetical protein
MHLLGYALCDIHLRSDAIDAHITRIRENALPTHAAETKARKRQRQPKESEMVVCERKIEKKSRILETSLVECERRSPW